jgi:hypothetical protein
MVCDFKEEMIIRQINWRKNILSNIKSNGRQNKVEKEYILPWEKRLSNFYPPIQNDLFDKTAGYIIKNKIQVHTGIHNLLSSWVLCANMYWPFKKKDGFILLKGYLSKAFGIKIASIKSMELEYEDDLLKPKEVIGEEEGSRGSGQTSPDLAIIFLTEDERKGILLIESKFTEKSFYPCSGYSKTKPGRPINSDKKRCLKPELITSSDFSECHLNSWGRKYWSLLKNHLDYNVFNSLKRCPMSSSCYQIFRQQALAVALEKKYDIVISCVASDSRNLPLVNCAKATGLKPFPQGWQELFPSAKFKWLNHNTWYEYVKANNLNGNWNEWLEYVEGRYF